MARPPKKADQPAANPLEKVTIDKLRDARRGKELFTLDFKECYFFSAPHRQRQISSQTPPPSTPMKDAPELQTSLAFELCQDFVTEVCNTFMPEAQRWCERGRGMFIPQKVYDKIKKQVAEDDGQIFQAMKASNLYPELAKAFYPDLAIGTVGLWIDQPRPHQPIVASAIPLRELEINLGPYGEIDDRFAVRYTRNCYVRSLLPGIDLPEETARTIDANPSERTELRWGFWRLWDRIDDECWQHVIMVRDKLVHHAVLEGEGSCPLLIGRFNPSADWPWGLGPMLQGLPDFRQIDELEAQKISSVTRSINPPITYPDDSFTNIEQGLEEGMAYPIRPGSEGAVKAIYDQPSIDVAVFQHEEMVKRLRRLFYIDYPEQSGDTPPTLGQWLDELARAQRRIGTPGLSFWREVPGAIFLRFKCILERAGVIEALKVDGKTISLQPMNPAQRAAEQQEISTAVQAIQILGQAFPEEFKAWIDGKQTMEAILDKMRVTMLKFRDPETVQAAVSQIGQLMGGQTPGASPAVPQPGSAPV